MLLTPWLPAIRCFAYLLAFLTSCLPPLLLLAAGRRRGLGGGEAQGAGISSDCAVMALADDDRQWLLSKGRKEPKENGSEMFHVAQLGVVECSLWPVNFSWMLSLSVFSSEQPRFAGHVCCFFVLVQLWASLGLHCTDVTCWFRYLLLDAVPLFCVTYKLLNGLPISLPVPWPCRLSKALTQGCVS